ncbi:Colossin-B like [Heracleum sosnowskyi]|uniref:Colossin-B like n=1 Tax=Heracleum sosnowskyi TaxID=360622 RepID=A0AAD8HAY0_9APIA|nr:Colossin-B like [Heracleum sosnowskyi]
MVLRRSIRRVKIVFHKRLLNIKSLVSKRYNQLSRAPSFKSMPSSNHRKMQQVDDLYRDISEESETDHTEVVEAKKSTSVTKAIPKDWNVSNRSLRSNAAKSFRKTTQEVRVKEEKKIAQGRGCILAEKIKELEIVDAYDDDHIMDIEEALHHYSLLTCPAYQDIVDNFFMDMYSEFLLPEPSASINNSMRRLHSMRL